MTDSEYPSELETIRRHNAEIEPRQPVGEKAERFGDERDDEVARLLARNDDFVKALDGVNEFLRRFLHFENDAQASAVTLWIIGTYVFDAFDVTPYLHIKSPQKRSGKSLLLELLELLSSQALLSMNVSPAALYRLVDDRRPTLLLDEIDTAFPKGRSSDPAKEYLRGLLNAGYRKSGLVYRATKHGKIEEFSAYCPKAFAGIGDLPDTVADRCIVIALQSKPRAVTVERFRSRIIGPEAADLAAVITGVTAGITPILEESFPHLPDELNDREQDSWELLLAIADYAGDHWPETARAAAIALSSDALQSTETIAQKLLTDMADVWGTDEASIPTSILLERLHDLEESPWGDWAGRPFSSRHLAKMLRPYGVSSSTIRHGDKTLKGYRKDALCPVWDRYIPAALSPRGETPTIHGTSQEPLGLQPDERLATAPQHPQHSLDDVADLAATSDRRATHETAGNLDSATVVSDVAHVAPPRDNASERDASNDLEVPY